MASSGSARSVPSQWAQPGAMETVCGARALALAPNSGADFLLLPQALDWVRTSRSSSEVRARAPDLPSRTRSGPVRMPDRSSPRASPSARLAPSPRPLPALSPVRPAHAHHAAGVARRLVGPAGSLAATSAAASKAASGGTTNELLGPRGRRPTAQPRPPMCAQVLMQLEGVMPLPPPKPLLPPFLPTPAQPPTPQLPPL